MDPWLDHTEKTGQKQVFLTQLLSQFFNRKDFSHAGPLTVDQLLTSFPQEKPFVPIQDDGLKLTSRQKQQGWDRKGHLA